MLNCRCITWPVGFKRLTHRSLQRRRQEQVSRCRWVRSNGRMTVAGKTLKYSEKIMFLRHYEHHKAQMDCPEVDPGQLHWDLWLIYWHWDSLFPKVLWFSPVSIIPPQIHTSLRYYRTKSIAGRPPGVFPKRQCSFGCQEALDKNVLSYSFVHASEG